MEREILSVSVQLKSFQKQMHNTTINDAIRLDFETKQVTRVIEIPEEEAYGAFDMERETPVFSPRFR